MNLLDRLSLANPTLRSLRVLIGPPVRWVLSSARGSWRNKHWQRAPQAEAIEVVTDEGLRLAARFYRCPEPALGPGVLMAHGWDPLGHRHGLYLALGSALMARGFHVMTFNLRGYPGSDPPATMEGFNLSSLVADVGAVANAFVETGWVDRNRLFFYGHSYGACLVLPALSTEPSLYAGGIVHGPSIWIEQRITGPSATKRSFFHERYWRYMQLDQPVPLPVYLKLHVELDMLNQVKGIPAKHPPILLVDAENDYPGTHEFMQVLLARISPPVEYYSVPGSDHFCNTAAWGEYVLRDRWTIGRLADTIVDWIARN